ALTGGCKHLRTITLNECFQVAKVSLQAIGTNLAKLESLSMAHCRNVTVEGLVSVAHGCPSLLSLDLSWCGDGISDLALAEFGRKCRSLKHLNLSHSSGFGSHGILAVCAHCKCLSRLNLSGC
ncbi:unnamed protein product, partial [Discosporangium mesarthrocarpum]